MWHEKIKAELTTLGFKPVPEWPSVFVRSCGNEGGGAIVPSTGVMCFELYVDDLFMVQPEQVQTGTAVIYDAPNKQFYRIDGPTTTDDSLQVRSVLIRRPGASDLQY